jgi:CheY-like chemotaxis protein
MEPCRRNTNGMAGALTSVMAHPIWPGGRPRVLIVEDDSSARGALVEILAFEGYTVEAAMDGFSGLAILADFDPQIILCDLGMPGMDGLAFVERARQGDRRFRLAIMSASHAGGEVAASLGAAYLPKPIDIHRLLDVMSQAANQFVS